MITKTVGELDWTISV